MPIPRPDWIAAVKKEPVRYLQRWSERIGTSDQFKPMVGSWDLEKIIGEFECSMVTARKLGIIAVRAWQDTQTAISKHGPVKG